MRPLDSLAFSIIIDCKVIICRAFLFVFLISGCYSDQRSRIFVSEISNCHQVSKLQFVSSETWLFNRTFFLQRNFVLFQCTRRASYYIRSNLFMVFFFVVVVFVLSIVLVFDAIERTRIMSPSSRSILSPSRCRVITQGIFVVSVT